MRTMATFVDHTLTWTKPKVFRSIYELRFGSELAATLCFQNIFSSAAIGEGGDGRWAFKRTGSFGQRVVIRACGSDSIAGTFTKNTWKEGGRLELSDGRKFLIIASLWKHAVEFRTELGEPLIHTNSRGIFRPSTTVQMYRKALHVPELPWMVMLGMYLASMMKRDAPTHAARG
jgi:hypothetical protein